MGRWRDAKKGKYIPKEKTVKVNENSFSDKNNLASVPSRIKAFITDSFLITTPIFYITIYFVMGSGDVFSQNKAYGWLLIFTVHFVTIMLFWLIKGQTPGLKAYEGKIVDNSNKGKISILQAFVRYMITTLAILSFFGMFLPFFRKDKRTLQDLLSNTCVIEDKSD